MALATDRAPTGSLMFAVSRYDPGYIIGVYTRRAADSGWPKSESLRRSSWRNIVWLPFFLS